MSFASRLGRQLDQQLGPRLSERAPQLASGFVQQALDRAIRGAGPLDGAAMAAEKALDAHRDDPDGAVSQLIEDHVRLAGAQGFVTNIGGLVTMTVAVPANIAGLALVQCRLVAAVAHLRGYDLADPRTRNAVLATLVGEEKLLSLVTQRKLPGTPMALATAPVHDPHLDVLVANEVASELMTRVAGKRLASTVGRRVPVVGGLVGAGTDGYATWRIGRYVDRELLPRRRR
ncbi:EcsC family protein [Nocardioides aurantiacus]|uniref:EcsC family protein n=1 Tax=Nocardioides aurantiacus TaxID=86796 RepID=A0A3N2CNW4_9ACTN|nr:EcsC family protein [Nocardioides aurantiacus]ROR89217.1 EcsC family protein [Nocardioides aurantiacus]